MSIFSFPLLKLGKVFGVNAGTFTCDIFVNNGEEIAARVI
jgi:hypothetical protein